MLLFSDPDASGNLTGDSRPHSVVIQWSRSVLLLLLILMTNIPFSIVSDIVMTLIVDGDPLLLLLSFIPRWYWWCWHWLFSDIDIVVVTFDWSTFYSFGDVDIQRYFIVTVIIDDWCCPVLVVTDIGIDIRNPLTGIQYWCCWSVLLTWRLMLLTWWYIDIRYCPDQLTVFPARYRKYWYWLFIVIDQWRGIDIVIPVTVMMTLIFDIPVLCIIGDQYWHLTDDQWPHSQSWVLTIDDRGIQLVGDSLLTEGSRYIDYSVSLMIGIQYSFPLLNFHCDRPVVVVMTFGDSRDIDHSVEVLLTLSIHCYSDDSFIDQSLTFIQTFIPFIQHCWFILILLTIDLLMIWFSIDWYW